MLGIDVSKQTLYCTLVDPSDKRVLWQKELPRTQDTVKTLLRRVPASTPWVLEPTGRYSLPVVKPAQAAGRTVLLAPTKRAKRFHESLSDRSKTDRLDRRSLALFALSQPLNDYPIPSETVEHLQQLLSVRKSLSLTRARLEQQAEEFSYGTDALESVLASVRTQLAALDEQIAALSADQTTFPPIQRLQQIPGIGPVTAASVGACLQSHTFPHSDQFVAFLGLDVAIRQSGKRKGDRGLSKQGDAELRRLLFNCARATLLSKTSPFRQQYERELAKGLSKTAVYCSIARKMARLCWSLVRYNTDYDPERVFQQKHERADKQSHTDKHDNQYDPQQEK